MNYKDLQEAIRILGLGERASIGEIKARHKLLVKRYHPDTGNDCDGEMIRKVNAAYRIVLDYVSVYRFSFTEHDFYDQNPEARIWRQFTDDALWGTK